MPRLGGSQAQSLGSFRLKTGFGSSQLGLKGNERSGFAADEG